MTNKEKELIELGFVEIIQDDNVLDIKYKFYQKNFETNELKLKGTFNVSLDKPVYCWIDIIDKNDMLNELWNGSYDEIIEKVKSLKY